MPKTINNSIKKSSKKLGGLGMFTDSRFKYPE